MVSSEEKVDEFRLKYRRPYRTGAYAFGFLLVCLLGVDASPALGVDASPALWVVLLALAFGWPQLAHVLCRRNPSVALDRGCFLADAVVTAIYLVVVGFNPWASLSLIFMHLMSGATAGGVQLVIKQLVVLTVCSGGIWFGFSGEFRPQTPIIVLGLSALSVIAYGCLIAALFRNNTKSTHEAMIQVERSGRDLSEALATLARAPSRRRRSCAS